jgi:hypothetical protein
MQFVQNDFYLFVVGSVCLHPVDAILLPVGMPITDRKVPPVCIRLVSSERTINIRATLQQASIFRSDVRSIRRSQSAQSGHPSVVQMGCLSNRVLEIHFDGSSSAFAAERATARLALPLNSESPPQPDCPSSSADASSSEMSEVLPVSRSK